MSQNATKPFGTQYTAAIKPGQDVVFQWTVQSSATYSVALALPTNSTGTSLWSLSGNPGFSLARLPNAVDNSLTYSSVPQDLTYYDFTAIPGSTTTIGGTIDFEAGSTATFILRSQSDSRLSFFERQCPLVGLLLLKA